MLRNIKKIAQQKIKHPSQVAALLATPVPIRNALQDLKQLQKKDLEALSDQLRRPVAAPRPQNVNVLVSGQWLEVGRRKLGAFWSNNPDLEKMFEEGRHEVSYIEKNGTYFWPCNVCGVDYTITVSKDANYQFSCNFTAAKHLTKCAEVRDRKAKEALVGLVSSACFPIGN